MLAFLLIIVIFTALRRPGITLALILNINNVKALLTNSCHPIKYDILENSVAFGVVTPALFFLILIIRLNEKEFLKYRLDIFDLFFIILCLNICGILFFASNFQENFLEASKIIFLGVPYYFVVKLFLVNSEDITKILIKDFFITVIILSLIMAVMACYFYITTDFIALQGYQMVQLTYPGVYVIPFSQMVGLGIIGSLFLLYYEPILKKKWLIIINVFLIIILLLTKNRGNQLSFIVSVLLFANIIFKEKISRKTLGLIFLIVSIFIITLIQTPEISNKLFSRILGVLEDKSILDRIESYQISFQVFKENIFGIGFNKFNDYYYLDYVHNILLEVVVFFGLPGILLAVILLAIFFGLLILKKNKENTYLNIAIILFVYYFIEAQFSYTLWMQKGLFISMAFLSVFSKYFRNEKTL
jgi:O-antigen ligase